MFPIPWNFPFKKKDGSTTTIDDAISAGGGGSYTLPTASAETKGGIKIGSGLSMSGEVLNNSNPTPYSLPAATADVLGGVKVGSGLSISDGVLNNSNPTPYSLPTAAAETKGGVKIGAGLTMDGEVLKDESTVLTALGSLINVDQDTALRISHDGDIYTISGYIELTDELNVGSRVQIGDGSIPESARISSWLGWFPMVVTMCDSGVTKFTIATLTVYPNGNMFINNNFADIKAKYLYVCAQYPKMSS